MANLNTPKQKKFSRADIPSVFMTPSSSRGQAVFPRPPCALIPPPPLSFPPTPSPTTRLEDHTDILGRLFENGFHLVTKQILSFLDQDDISRCVQVSHCWKELFSSDQTPPSPKQPAITLDENNAGQSPDLKPFVERRQPLKIIANTTRKNPPATCSLPMKRARLTMTPCPRCPSPAKVLSNRRAECTSCSFEFCQKCLKSWHELEQDSCGIHSIPTSPKKSNSALPIACAKSKKSRKNLKRL